MANFIVPDVKVTLPLFLRRHSVNVLCDVDVSRVVDHYEELRALGYTREAAIERLAPTVGDSIELELAPE